MPTLLDVFIYQDKTFKMYLFVTEDDRTEIQLDDEVKLTFSATGDIILPYGRFIGRISIRNDSLVYYLNNGIDDIFETHISIKDIDCYFKAEKMIFQHLIDLGIIHV